MWDQIRGGAFVRTIDGTKSGGIRGQCQCGCPELILCCFGEPDQDSLTLQLECPLCLARLRISVPKSGQQSMEAP
jgi:hypothetical protein